MKPYQAAAVNKTEANLQHNLHVQDSPPATQFLPLQRSPPRAPQRKLPQYSYSHSPCNGCQASSVRQPESRPQHSYVDQQHGSRAASDLNMLQLLAGANPVQCADELFARLVPSAAQDLVPAAASQIIPPPIYPADLLTRTKAAVPATPSCSRVSAMATPECPRPPALAEHESRPMSSKRRREPASGQSPWQWQPGDSITMLMPMGLC